MTVLSQSSSHHPLGAGPAWGPTCGQRRTQLPARAEQDWNLGHWGGETSSGQRRRRPGPSPWCDPGWSHKALHPKGPCVRLMLCSRHPDILSAFEPGAHIFILQQAPQIQKLGLLHALSLSLKSALSWLFTSLTTEKPHNGSSQVTDASVAPAAGQALVSALTPWAAVPRRPLS